MKTAALATALLALIVPAVHADPLLEGRVVTTAFYYPNQSTIGFGGVPVDSFVGAGIEILASPQGFPITSIDFADASITLDFSASLSGTVAPFNGWRFYDAYNNLPAFTSASLTTFDTSGWSITFDADNIWLNGSGSVYLTSSRIQIDIASSSVTPAIPEPGTTWLLAAGLAAMFGLVGARRRVKPGRVASRIEGDLARTGVAVVVAAVLAACGGDPATGACVRGTGATATCGNDFTSAQCNLVNGDAWYEGRVCKGSD